MDASENKTNLHLHKSPFVECEIAGTINRWRKTDKAIKISTKTNTKHETTALVFQCRLTKFIRKIEKGETV